VLTLSAGHLVLCVALVLGGLAPVILLQGSEEPLALLVPLLVGGLVAAVEVRVLGLATTAHAWLATLAASGALPFVALGATALGPDLQLLFLASLTVASTAVCALLVVSIRAMGPECAR
jgi:hypothetical protein